MENYFDIPPTHYCSINEEPPNPVEGDIWSVQEGNFIKAYAYIDDQWTLITDLSTLESGWVRVSYDPTEEGTEEIDLMDYQYRLGI